MPIAAITAAGMVTPVGAGARMTAAGLRARLAMFAELSGHGLDARVVGAKTEGLPPPLPGGGRASRLAAEAVADLLEMAGLDPRDLGAAGLYFAAGGPEGAHWLADIPELVGLSSRPSVVSQGHAGAFVALQEALADLERGKRPRAIVGGADSLVEPGELARLHAEGALKGQGNPTGVLPGEGAAFILLEPVEAALARGATILATLEAVATASPALAAGADAPADGAGLSQAGWETLGALSDAGIATDLVVADLDGTERRAEDFAYFAARCLASLGPAWRLEHPADTLGDTRAASAPIAIAAAALGLHSGSSRAEGVLVCGASDGPLRGTAYLRAHRRGA